MAFFGFKKKADAKLETQNVKREEVQASDTTHSTLHVGRSMANVLVRPRITEKAANMTSTNVYTFDIGAGATKQEVAEAVKAIYKVTPVKVNVVNTPAKRVQMRKKRGFGKTAATRKAYVFLKKGEEIQFT